MTQPDKWDYETERLTRSYWDDCMGDEISVSRSELSNALRSAYAEGEKAGMEKAEHWRTLALNVVAAWEVLGMGHHHNRIIERWLGDDMAPAINAIRAAKETKE